MARVLADRNRCEGYAICVSIASDMFDVDDDGKVVVLIDPIDDGQRSTAGQAAQSCPSGALSLLSSE